MNANSSDTVAPASTELTEPANSTPKPTSPIASAPSQAEREQTVPTQTNTAPASASPTCAWSRSRIGPPKSTSNSIANEPNAANVATAGLPITSSPSANMAGMTKAARPARRNAANPGSRPRSHPCGSITHHPPEYNYQAPRSVPYSAERVGASVRE